MKSKLEQSDPDNLEEDSGEDYDDFQDDGEEYEVDASGPGVASAKGSKMVVIFSSTILVTVVLYFFFFKGGNNTKTDKTLDGTIPITEFSSETPAQADNIDDFADLESEEEDIILEKPQIPDVPKLPELETNSEENLSEVLPSFIDLPKKEKVPTIVTQPFVPTVPRINSPTPIRGRQPVGQQGQLPADQQVAIPIDPRRSPIIVVGGGAGPGNSVGYENNIIQLKENAISQLKKTESTIIPTIVSDRSHTITQGKMLNAVLETAINTEIPGSVRGIISRDVYGEAGNNVLIPRGSRLYGSYSSQVIRGQGRVEISWTRLIRPDGVDIAITFDASDQFGRAGIEGDVNNKYGSMIGNSLLTSVLAIGGAIAAEKLSDSGSTTTTVSPTDGTTTSSGSASSQAITDVTTAIIDTMSQVATNSINVSPVIRVPQGTRLTIISNADITLPAVVK